MARLIGLILIVVVLFVGWRTVRQEPERVIVGVDGILAEQPAVSSLVRQDDDLLAGPSGGEGAGDLSAGEVRSWCVENCAHHRFEELQEGANAAVHMTTGVAATLNVPAGVSVDGWNCRADHDAVGPVTWTGCEATFRRI